MKTIDTMYEMKNTLDGINGRWDTAKEKTDELEGTAITTKTKHNEKCKN